MCGIAGLAGSFAAPGRAIGAMASRLAHRGPDDEGYLAVNTAAGRAQPLSGKDSRVPNPPLSEFAAPADLWLGFRRLSILDVSPAGHQPMQVMNGRFWIVFNGEIYNHADLREELKRNGFAFRSHSDTEVLAAAYAHWGAGCLPRLNGMWAFAVYDMETGVLFCARDRFGVKPFYYLLCGAGLAFASEIKALLALPECGRAVNRALLREYLVNGSEGGERTFFENVRELPAGHSFEYRCATRQFDGPKAWYRLGYEAGWEPGAAARMPEHAARVRERVFRAVERRLEADVPLGSCLSGGLDSSAVVCCVRDLLAKKKFSAVGDRQKTFTACFPGFALDESAWAEQVSRHAGTAWFQTRPEATDLRRDVADLVYSQDIPFCSSSVYAQYRVMRLAGETGVRVLLDGQGGDEVFAGYRPLLTAFLADAARHGDWRRLVAELRASGAARTLAADLARLGVKGLPGVRPFFLRRRLKSWSGWFNPDFWNEPAQQPAAGQAGGGLNAQLHRLMCGPGLQRLLKYEDRNSMRFAVEARTPFADDHELIEAVFALPASCKIEGGWMKQLLRLAMAGVVPEPVRLRRDKIGFAPPEDRWLAHLAREPEAWFTPALAEFFNVARLSADWPGMCAAKDPALRSLAWRLFNAAAWHRVFFQDRR